MSHSDILKAEKNPLAKCNASRLYMLLVMLSDLCINIIRWANPAVLWHCIAVGPQTDGVSAYSSQGF